VVPNSSFAEKMLKIIEEPEDAIIIMSDEAHFHLNGSTNRISDTGPHRIPVKCMKDRHTA
jgi:hypothetical protein